MKNTIKAIMMATLFLALTQLTLAAPANDSWQNATPINSANGIVSGSVTGATTQQCEPGLHVYPDEGQSLANGTVWYKWLVPATGSYTFDFDPVDTTANTVLSAYRMSLGICNGSLASIPYRIVENHRYNADLGTGIKSRISFKAVAGELIYIAVDSYNDQGGSFDLRWSKTRFRYDVSLDHKNGGTDLMINRTLSGDVRWWTARYSSSTYYNEFASVRFGLGADKRFLADYDGDRISEMVSVRQENGKLTWWIGNRDGEIVGVVQFGLATDRPVIGDYDGDGIADIAVTRIESDDTKTWHILRSSDGQYSGLSFGIDGDKEMVGDYDGDGKTDIVVLRSNGLTYRWYILLSSSSQVVSREFGNAGGDIPQVADFDGDGKTDITVFRMYNAQDPLNETWDGYWFSLDSSSLVPLAERPTRYQKFGVTVDEPQPGDYDGDGRTDLAVFRDGLWYIRRSSNGQVVVAQFGQVSDSPRSDGGRFLAFRSY